MTERIAPLEPLPEYKPLEKRAKSTRRNAKVIVRVRPAPPTMPEGKEAVLDYIKHWARIVATDLAHANGSKGITASEVRIEGEKRGKWVADQFKGKEFSFLSGMFRGMGLVCTDAVAMSDIPTARNDNHVWILKQYDLRAG